MRDKWGSEREGLGRFSLLTAVIALMVIGVGLAFAQGLAFAFCRLAPVLRGLK